MAYIIFIIIEAITILGIITARSEIFKERHSESEINARFERLYAHKV